MHTGDRQTHDSRREQCREACRRPMLGKPVAYPQRDEGKHNRNDDRQADQSRVVPNERVGLHRGHAGIVHGADSRTH
jgi:hypothetical protein